jgi:hypothetical protein
MKEVVEEKYQHLFLLFLKYLGSNLRTVAWWQGMAGGIEREPPT